ncbi:MAG TPA: hypothetical protein PLS94_08570 [Prolixibacteraceae bacterium]|nr:hypothetical protein [Prolixibacteraceae bacterium]HPR60609.1 hypothetical protein [Prolixibacteraceae bacterium]
MKKILFFTLALLATIAIMAQPPGGGMGMQFDPEEMVKRQTEQMTNDLGLNAEQTKKVEALNKKYSEKMSEMFQNAGEADRSKFFEKMQTIREEKNKELKGILTDEQYKKHIELEEQRMQQRRDRAQQGGPNQPGRRGAPRGGGNQ